MANPTTVQKKKSSPFTTAILFATFGLVLLIMLDNNLRLATGTYVGYLFDPLIGFNHEQPVLTIFLASVVLVIATTVIRHFLVDWVNMARVQEAMRSFQKEFAEARKSNNTYKLKKLTDAQPELMQLQASMTTDQMKPMAFTMLLVIPIFAWLSHFVVTLSPDATTCGPYIAVPWELQWDLGAHTRDQCAEGYAKLLGWRTPFPHWIALYSLFGIPFGQIAQKILKLWEYRRVDLDADGVPAGKHE
jgi:uncharacterized membrane protein (DUF106 family)